MIRWVAVGAFHLGAVLGWVYGKLVSEAPWRRVPEVRPDAPMRQPTVSG